MLATRIKHLPPGTVHFDVIIHKDITGTVVVQPSCTGHSTVERNGHTSPNELEGGSQPGDEGGSRMDGAGKITYELNGSELEIPLYGSDCTDIPRVEDMVRFDINQLKATKETNAVNITIMESPAAVREKAEKAAAEAQARAELLAKRELRQRETDRGGPATYQGYIAALKDG